MYQMLRTKNLESAKMFASQGLFCDYEALSKLPKRDGKCRTALAIDHYSKKNCLGIVPKVVVGTKNSEILWNCSIK